MHFLRSSAIESWNQPRLKINSLTFYKMNFHTQNVSKKLFLHWMRVRAHPGTRKRKALAPQSNEKKLFGNILSVKIHFVKSQGTYVESGLVSDLSGWTSQKMHAILLCLKFETVVDLIWKSFLVCLITWMLNFFQIKYFDVDTHDHLILEVYTSLVNVRGFISSNNASE